MSFYENPYMITGHILLAHPKKAPKYVCTDRINGTRKASKFFAGERGVTTYEVFVMKMEEQALVNLK